MPEIEIRPAALSDLPLIIHMERSYHTSYVWQMDRLLEEGQVTINFREIRLPRSIRVENPRSPDSTLQSGDQKNGILVAVLDQEVVGYIGLKEVTVSSYVWVTDLVVIEKLRRKGIASALLLAAQEWGAQRNLKRIILEMHSKNIPAIRMAKKMGYDFCGYNDHYYPNQEIALFFAGYMR